MSKAFSCLFISILLILLTSSPMFAQDISGRIIDAKTKEPLPFVSVYISKTTKGTQSDEKGYFSLKNVPTGYLKLATSMIGYKSFEQEFVIKPNENRTLKIQLNVNSKELSEVIVVGKRGKQWKRNYAHFLKIFLGKSKNVKKTEITNPHELNFALEKKVLTANAENPLIIKNQALGYDIDYSLATFHATNEDFQFGGNVFFKPIPQTDEIQQKLVEKNREKAYKGSIRHFFKSIVKGTSQEEGFRVYLEKDTLENIARNRFFRDNFPKKLKEVNINTLAKFDVQLQRIILPKNRYEIHYLQQRDNSTFYSDINHEVSWIETKGDNFKFSYQGISEEPLKLLLMGSMGNRRVADFVPDDYELPNNAKDSTQNSLTIPNYQPHEKVFIRTDRDAYFPHDTIWFKAYTLDATTHKPSPSKILHVTLRNEKKVFSQQQFLIEDGISQGFIPLSDSLSSICQLIGHTEWMRNYDEDLFFRKNVKILSKEILPETVSSDSIQIQLFPEGGNLIEGISNRMGLRATYPDGSFTNVSVEYIDKSLDSTETSITQTIDIQGIGDFFTTPNMKHTIQIKLKNGKAIRFPPTLKKGFALQVRPLINSENIMIKLYSNLVLSEFKTLRFIIHQKGQIIYENDFLPKSKITTFIFPKDNLTEKGIVNVLILDALNNKIAERVFYNYNDSNRPIVNLKSKDGGVDIKILDQDSLAIEGSTLVSCADKRFINEESKIENLKSFLLLNSDLKYALEPSKSILDPNIQNKERLDLMLLANSSIDYTQGNEKKFEPQLGITIKGWAKNFDKKKPAEIVGYVNTKNWQLGLKAIADGEGRFETEPLIFEDTAKFKLQFQQAQEPLTFEIEAPEIFIPKWRILPKMNFKTNLTEDAKINALRVYQDSLFLENLTNKVSKNAEILQADKVIQEISRFSMGKRLYEVLNNELPEFVINEKNVFLRDSTKHSIINISIDGIPMVWQNISLLPAYMIKPASIHILTDSLKLSAINLDANTLAINILSTDGEFLKTQKFRTFTRIGLTPKRDFINSKTEHKNIGTYFWKVDKMNHFAEKQFIEFWKSGHLSSTIIEGISTTGEAISVQIDDEGKE